MYRDNTTIGTVFMMYIIILIIGGIPTYFLWNWLMPTLFSLSKVTFFQAIGLNVLTHMLFKGDVNVKSKRKSEN